MARQMSSSRPLILVVEDDSLSRKALVCLLKQAGYSPMASGSAEGALELLRDGPCVEFALIDLNLPGMNGLQLIHRLRQTNRALTPILMTACDVDELHAEMSVPEMEERMREASVEYIQKPLHLPELLNRLNSLERAN